jgi:hypothetical protein
MRASERAARLGSARAGWTWRNGRRAAVHVASQFRSCSSRGLRSRPQRPMLFPNRSRPARNAKARSSDIRSKRDIVARSAPLEVHKKAVYIVAAATKEYCKFIHGHLTTRTPEEPRSKFASRVFSNRGPHRDPRTAIGLMTPSCGRS